MEIKRADGDCPRNAPARFLMSLNKHWPSSLPLSSETAPRWVLERVPQNGVRSVVDARNGTGQTPEAEASLSARIIGKRFQLPRSISCISRPHIYLDAVGGTEGNATSNMKSGSCVLAAVLWFCRQPRQDLRANFIFG
jgi:hypothetical protein